jgi:hypothetical protein
MTTETQTTAPKYQVVPNQCSCHPETCCCDDWAIFENGSKKLTMHRKEDADEYAATLNKSATYPEQATPLDYAGFISNAPFYRNNLICKVIYDSSAYNTLLPDSKRVVDAVKQLLELNTAKIEGLEETLLFPDEPGHESEYRRFGEPVHTFLPNYETYTAIPNLLKAWYGLNFPLHVIYVEPDGTMMVVVRFWYFENVKPHYLRSDPGKRDVTKELENTQYTLTFYCELNESEDTKIAQTVLDDLNRAAINPFK